MSDEEPKFAPRLDQIDTMWSLVRQAHVESTLSSEEARQQLVRKYFPSIRSYVSALMNNQEDSHEVAQDVVVRLMRGDFGGADPDRGRFRDLLKVAVRNMVRSYWQKSNRRTGVDYELDLIESDSPNEDDDAWLGSFRDNLMQNAWQRLESLDKERAGGVLATVLRTKASYPDESSQQLSDRVSQIIDKQVRADHFRQLLRRARIRFSEFLVDEIVQGLKDPSIERVQDELVSLGLYEQVKNVLPQEWRVD